MSNPTENIVISDEIIYELFQVPTTNETISIINNTIALFERNTSSQTPEERQQHYISFPLVS